MKKLVPGAAVLLAMLLPGFILGGDKNPPKEPFYRRYLVAGNPLDDKILEQEKRVEANPSSANLRNDFGNLLAARRFPKEAREQYEAAMKLDRHYFLAPYNLGLLYETIGETGRAIGAYEKSVDRNRGFPPARFRLGRLYEKRGRQGKAIEQYTRALQIDPGMRDPKRNPLVVDTRLLDRVSLENYPRDLAAASMTADAVFADPARMRKVPRDRTLSSEDLEPAAPEAPAGAKPASGPTPVRVIAPSTPARRPPPAPIRNLPPVVPAPTPELEVDTPQSTEPPAVVPTPDATVRLPVGAPPLGAPPRPIPTPESN
jgi:Tetratricopeptide repeat